MPETVDAAAIAELFDRYAAALELYASQRTTSPQDCVQEAFIALARQTSMPADPAAWLFRVVHNRALNSTRAEQRRLSHEEGAGLLSQGHQRQASDPQRPCEVADLLQVLTPGQREVVVLRIWGRLSWQEVANVVGRSRSAVHRCYEQSLSQLRNRLERPSCPTKSPEDVR